MAFEKRHLKRVAFLVLVVVTLWGLHEFFRGDWRASLAYWHGKGGILGAALALHTLNLLLDAFLWMLVLRQFGIRTRFPLAWMVYLSGFAGLLFPLQLGRFIRSEVLARLKLGTFAEAVKAEVAFMFLSSIGAFAMIGCALGCALWIPLGLAAPLLITAAFLFVADRAFGLLPKVHFELPRGYWWRWSMFGMALLVDAGWVLNAGCLYLVVHDLPGGVTFLQALFTAPASLLVGVSTGLPGGIGAIEGFLGVSLTFMDVPATHLALAVGAFRLITFWLWLPIGWLAFSVMNRKASQAAGTQNADGETAHDD